MCITRESTLHWLCDYVSNNKIVNTKYYYTVISIFRTSITCQSTIKITHIPSKQY